MKNSVIFVQSVRVSLLACCSATVLLTACGGTSDGVTTGQAQTAAALSYKNELTNSGTSVAGADDSLHLMEMGRNLPAPHQKPQQTDRVLTNQLDCCRYLLLLEWMLTQAPLLLQKVYMFPRPALTPILEHRQRL